MDQLGLGALLSILRGNEETVAAVRASIGKTTSPNLVLVKISGYKTLHRMHKDFFEETKV